MTIARAKMVEYTNPDKPEKLPQRPKAQRKTVCRHLPLKRPVLGSFNNFPLVILIQIHEIVTVSGDAHQQIAVVIGTGLGFFKCLAIHDVKLDVMPFQSEIGSDEVREFADVRFGGKNIRQEPLIQQSSPRFDLVHFCQRFNNGCGPVAICAVGWRSAVGNGFARQSTIGCRPQHVTEIDVAGQFGHGEPEGTTPSDSRRSACSGQLSTHAPQRMHRSFL